MSTELIDTLISNGAETNVCINTRIYIYMIYIYIYAYVIICKYIHKIHMLHACETDMNITENIIFSAIIIQQNNILDTQSPLLAAAVVTLFRSKSEHRNSIQRYS